MTEHNIPLNEATLDPIERAQRRVRSKKVIRIKKLPEPIIKRKADPITKKKHDPTNTAIGKGSLRGSRHRWINQRKSRKYNEAVDFILNAVGKPIDEVLERASGLHNTIDLIHLIDKLIAANVNLKDLEAIKEAVSTMITGKGYRSEPAIAKTGDTEGEELALKKARRMMCDEYIRQFPRRWIERIEDSSQGIVRYFAMAETNFGGRLEKAESDPRVQIIK